MKSLMPAAFLLFCLSAFAQENTRYTYLVVHLESRHDWPNDKSYWIIRPELSNAYAKDIYSIIPYNSLKKAINKTGNFYPSVQDSALPFYNYFTDRTQALQFMADHDWELQAIDSDISSTVRTYNSTEQIYTEVSSRPVYYFRKKVLTNGALNQKSSN